MPVSLQRSKEKEYEGERQEGAIIKTGQEGSGRSFPKEITRDS